MFFVLDLDDTLYLERDFVKSGFRAVDKWVIENLGINEFFSDAWRLFNFGKRDTIFNEVISKYNLFDQRIIEKMVRIYRSHRPKISLCQDSIDFLNSHSKNEICMITDGYSHVQWSKIKALSLENFFEKIIVTDDWGMSYWKPHPRSFIEISKGHDNKECIYIGDNPEKDFRAPIQLKWSTSFRIRRKGSLHYDKITTNECVEIESFYDIQ